MLVMIILIVVIVLLLIVVYLLHKNNKQFSQQQPKPSVTLTALPAPEAILHSTPPSHLGLPNTLPQPVPVGNDSKSSLQIAILPIIVVGDRNEKVNLLHNGDNKAEKGGGKMGTSKKENYLERRNPTQNSISSEVLFGDKCNDENSKKEEDATSLSGSDSSSSKFDEQEAAAVFKATFFYIYYADRKYTSSVKVCNINARGNE
ncbi:unnamed protein product [Meloidogyne enterolobii]|uniref:Uncharacterized protein n=1 Tax=Meloidogyne enterolobii TaxID=390850 RepID=A0ACB1A4W6_MELEN